MLCMQNLNSPWLLIPLALLLAGFQLNFVLTRLFFKKKLPTDKVKVPHSKSLFHFFFFLNFN